MTCGGADYVARKEDVLNLYPEAPTPRCPRVCVDEHPYQLISKVRGPLPATLGRPARCDYAYPREVTCNLFVIFQPETGWHEMVVTDRRTTQDFAHLLKRLMDEMFPYTESIRLVTDNLNTHSDAALYATVPPAEARITVPRTSPQYGKQFALDTCSKNTTILYPSHAIRY